MILREVLELEEASFFPAISKFLANVAKKKTHRKLPDFSYAAPPT